MQTTAKHKELIRLSAVGYDSFGLASAIMLSWIMKADGRISKSELSILEDYLKQFNLLHERKLFFDIIDDFDDSCILFATTILKRNLTNEGRRLTLDMLLGMVIDDGYITFTEMYVIEFIADIFGYTPTQLNQIFIETTGRAKLDHGDPSSAEWWKKKEKNSSENKNEEKKYNGSKKRTNRLTERQKALAILGLDSNATDADIKSAFRLLTKVHHPDRFHKIGEEAKRSANKTYIRIKDAYELLIER